jgi:hypothetical protein
MVNMYAFVEQQNLLLGIFSGFSVRGWGVPDPKEESMEYPYLLWVLSE